MVRIAEIYQDEIKISQDGSCPRDDRKNLSRTVCSLGFFSKVVHANVCKFCCLCKVGDPLATSRFAPMAAYLAIFRPCVRGGLASVSVFPGLKCRLILYCNRCLSHSNKPRLPCIAASQASGPVSISNRKVGTLLRLS